MHNIFLYIIQGEPYNYATVIYLPGHRTLIGRSWNGHQPDISFNSLLISRKHAEIVLEKDRCYIKDLASKHGTHVNGRDIGQNQACPLSHGDKIDLARGEVKFIFNNLLEADAGETVELGEALLRQRHSGSGTDSLCIVPERREVFVNGQPVNLSGKDLDLLLLLYDNRGKAVNYDEIKRKIWPERQIDITNTPDVGNDEITALVYRLRKRLGNSGQYIVSIPRYGYMLESK
ncbi:FHA domain-containing protein [Thermincola potens]|uniref:Putative two component transcriptional regulator, winged helix family n=1 Tax=Thermincola potens (strain JR) TaxID=635013 RepID=D5XAS7_THEPJ|nr:FHA domain-containing protein [Thermincola potens]ADG83281.1 putative two component transcriptional regulator, winged helix family [Thermincola potens JR]